MNCRHLKSPCVLLSLIMWSTLVYADDLVLDNVEVSAEADTPLNVVSTEQLLKVPGAGNDPLRAIESLPGVVFSKGGEAKPAIRGSSPDDNAYYIDLTPVGYLFHTDGSSILNDNVIESFTFIPGAFGAEYNNATGGVIDTRTRSPYYDQSQAIIDMSLLRAGFLVETPVSDDQAFYFTARQSLFQFYIENIIDSDEFEFTTLPEFYDYQGKYEVRLNATDTLSLQVIGARDKAAVLFTDDSAVVSQDPGKSGGFGFEQYFNSQGLQWDAFYSNGLTQSINLSQLEQKFQFFVGSGNYINAKVNDYRLRSRFSYALNYRHELQWGLEFSERHLAAMGRFEGPPCDEFKSDCRFVEGTEIIEAEDHPVIYETNAFLSDNWDVNENWTLTPGVLLSYNDYTENAYVEPKLNSRWMFQPDWWLTQGYGRYHSLPENFGQYAKEFGNPELNEPKATHYVTGLEHQMTPTLLWKIEAYYKTFADIPIARPSKSPLYDSLSDEQYNALPRYTNDAEGDAWGLELFVNKQLSQRWYGWASVAWSRTRRENTLTNEDFRYAYDQPVIVNLVANYQWDDDWQLGFKWRVQSGQLVTPIDDVVVDSNNPDLYNPIYGKPYSERLPVYHRLDVRADRTYRFARWEMDLYIEVLNLYAQRNVIDYNYDNADYSERNDVLDLPFIPSFGIRARL